MNSDNTFDSINSQYTSQLTSHNFHPESAKWINYNMYYPHSNECGPRTMLALTIMSIHPSLSNTILLLFMDANIAQLSRWWITKSIISVSVDLTPIITTFSDKYKPPTLSLQREAYPYNIARLPKPTTHSQTIFHFPTNQYPTNFHLKLHPRNVIRTL
jgi:hypothetical protein